MSLDEIWRIRDRVVGRTDLNRHFPPNSHVQPEKIRPMTSIRVTRSDMASECERSLFWSFFLFQVAPSASFSTLTVTPSPFVLPFSKALSRYTFNTLFPKHLFPSFRISFVFRAMLSLPRLSLCSAGIHSSYAIPGETRQFSLFPPLFIFPFFCILYVYFFCITLSGFLSLRYPSKYARGTQRKICPIHENKIICIAAC